MADEEKSNTEKAQEIIDKTADSVADTTQDDPTNKTTTLSDGSANADTQQKPGADGKDGDAGNKTQYAGKYETPEKLQEGVNELANKLGISRLERRQLQSVIKEAEEAGDWKELEEIYKEFQAKTTRADEDARRKAAGADDPTKKDAAKDTVVKIPSREEQTQYLTEQMTARVAVDPLMREIKDAGVELPEGTKFGSSAWLKFMKEVRTADVGLYVDLQKRVEELAHEEVDFLERYTQTAQESTTSRQAAETDGMKFLDDVDKELEIGFTADDKAEIIAQALSDNQSYSERYGIKVLKKDAVSTYFLTKLLRGKTKGLIEKAKTAGRLDSSKDAEDMRKKAMSTVSTTKLSQGVNRKGTDAAKFDTHAGAEKAGHEAREARVKELLAGMPD